MFSKTAASKDYSKYNIEVLDYIKTLHAQFFTSKNDNEAYVLPTLLQTDVNKFKLLNIIPIASLNKTKAKNPPDINRFQKEFWTTKIGKQVVIGRHISKIVSLICDYQEAHLNNRGSLTRNHIGDASILVLELIKEGCVALSNCDEAKIEDLCKDDSDLFRWIRFIEALESSKKFPQGNHPFTRMGVFCEVRMELQILLENLKLYLANRSSYEELQVVRQKGRALLSEAVGCLHYILRNEFTIQNSDLLSLRNPVGPEAITQMRCLLGQLMRELLNSPVFAFLIEANEESLTDAEIQDMEPVLTWDEKKWDAYPGLNEWLLMLTDESNLNAIGTESRLLKPEIIKNFILLHGMIEELGYCLLGCELAFYNSRNGGDLLIYGLLTKPVADTMANTIFFINKISNALSDLRKTLDIIYRDTILERKLPEIEEWLKNYTRAKSHMRNYAILAEDCAKTCGMIYTKAANGIDSKRLNQIIKMILRFVGLTESMNKRLGKESCVKDLPEAIKTLVTDATHALSIGIGPPNLKLATAAQAMEPELKRYRAATNKNKDKEEMEIDEEEYPSTDASSTLN